MSHTLTKHLRRWAAARDWRLDEDWRLLGGTRPGAHGETGTALLRDAADRIDLLEKVLDQLRDASLVGEVVATEAEETYRAWAAHWSANSQASTE